MPRKSQKQVFATLDKCCARQDLDNEAAGKTSVFTMQSRIGVEGTDPTVHLTMLSERACAVLEMVKSLTGRKIVKFTFGMTATGLDSGVCGKDATGNCISPTTGDPNSWINPTRGSGNDVRKRATEETYREYHGLVILGALNYDNLPEDFKSQRDDGEDKSAMLALYTTYLEARLSTSFKYQREADHTLLRPTSYTTAGGKEKHQIIQTLYVAWQLDGVAADYTRMLINAISKVENLEKEQAEAKKPDGKAEKKPANARKKAIKSLTSLVKHADAFSKQEVLLNEELAQQVWTVKQFISTRDKSVAAGGDSGSETEDGTSDYEGKGEEI